MYGNNGNQWGYSNKDSARQAQIANFLRTFPASKRLPGEPETYEMPIRIGKSNLFVKIFLEKNFPLQPPLIQVMALVDHPLLDHKMYVHHRDCDNWTSACTLVNVMMDVVKAFQSNPPKPRARKSTGPGNPQGTKAAQMMQNQTGNNMNMNAGNFNSNNNGGGNQSNNSGYGQGGNKNNQLTAPLQFQELYDLDTFQLQNLAEKDGELNDYAREHVMVRSLIDRHDEVLRENTEIATTTITGKEELEELSEQYKTAFEQYEEKRSANQDLVESQEMIIQRFSRANVLQHLEERYEEVQNESRELEKEGFTSGDPDEFIEQYMEKRKLYHTLKAKHIQYSLTANQSA